MGPSAVETHALRNGRGNDKGTDSSSLTLVTVNDVGVSGPSWGDVVTFKVTTPATSPFISVNCYQGSTWVYAAGGYPVGWTFTLTAIPGRAARLIARQCSIQQRTAGD